MPPDFLAIGHVAKDLSPRGFTIGGSVAYAALTARAMGLKAAVVTSAGPDLDLHDALHGIMTHVVPSSDSTAFVNSYRGRRRTQVLKAVAAPITRSDVPVRWLSAPLVLLGPIAGEVGADLATSVRGGVVLASLQGWLRKWDRRGLVGPAYWDGADVLPYVDAALVSEDDPADLRQIDIWKEMVRVLITTKGAEGAGLHFDGAWHNIAPFPTTEVDGTGAGDVFAAAYLIRYRETGDPVRSAVFASCAASFSVEAEGVGGIPSRAQVEERLKATSPAE